MIAPINHNIEEYKKIGLEDKELLKNIRSPSVSLLYIYIEAK
jgi:hypothetical protein